MSAWINYHAVWKILVFGLLVGAGLPALFAVGVRLNAEGAGGTGDATVARRNPVLGAISSVILAVVLIAVTIAVLYVARDFIGQHTGAYILGAKHN
jgi:Zn-dependent protease with chaperone function